MPPDRPTAESRARAERVFFRRAIEGQSWSVIRDAEGFGSIGAAQSAYARYIKRNPPPSSQAVMTEVMARKRITTSQAIQAMAEARAAGDHDAFAKLAAVVGREDAELAKMAGLYAPERHDVQVAVTAEDTRARLLALAAERDQLTARRPAAIEGEVIR
ncbi:hypothetical protein [Rhodococcus aetherivorans]|uniref:hypothetical protein n=1 Tax=Rhodococcus aetherivorans TaxID=191292 RepID=UPI001E61DD16|nr:hypothetical protein [Rhodococcus aetherivorans]UGQ43406.1 hypothetical protein LRQ66_09045 [Rhodococcus aetherivorans]